MKGSPPLWDHRCLYLLSWKRFDDAVQQLTQSLRPSEYDVMICIVRGGLVLGTALAHFLDIQHFAVLHIQRNATSDLFPDRLPPRLLATSSLPIPQKSRVLLIDDIVGSGATLQTAIEALRVYEPLELQTASLAVNLNGLKGNALRPDHHVFAVDDWLVFPWENQENARSRQLPLKEL